MASKFYRHPAGFLDNTDVVELDENGKYFIIANETGQRNPAPINHREHFDSFIQDGIWAEVPYNPA